MAIDMHGVALIREPDRRKGERRRNAEQLRAAGVDIKNMPARRMMIRDRRKT